MRPLLLSLLFPCISFAASPVIEAFGELSAETRDANGDTIGGIGSGISYDAKNGGIPLPFRPRSR